ncbi:MutS-related protein [Thermococcus gorgonarius]|uniref:DNA-binding protein MutS2 n=1 Tax=Thermococcus gorgonarius TaxID=71997 RepID=A0A2Z2MEM1_THEGO|nr:DNA mismatch repair protein [Thermococcus gorgonarius]ASJ00901.1 DNA mismatch repair protein [Thermococcus gorgonarius]
MSLKLNPEARAIYRSIRDEIAKKLLLRGSEAFLDEFSPTTNPEEIARRQAYLRENLQRIKPEIGEFIEKVQPIHFRREYLHDRILIVDESEVEKAEALGLCAVSTDPADAEDYPLVLSTVGYGIDVELTPTQITPELYVQPLWENRDTLEALAKIAELTGEKSIAPELLKQINDIKTTMDRLSTIEQLEEILHEKELELNEKISKRLEQFSLTLKGKELLEFLSELKSGDYGAIFRHFSSVENEILEMIREVEEELEESLGTSVEIFSREELYPVSVPPERIELIREELTRDFKVEMYLKSRELAEKIRPLIPRLKQEIRNVYRLDFLRAVKLFTEGFSFPELGDNGIAFLKGRHIFIENPQPVSYVIGKKPEWFDVEGSERVLDENVVILTGANSGGKTSLLELVTQIAILTHMGLPVPAERAGVSVLDEIFFFRRKRSTYGAGAFETALNGFVKALKNEGRKLILIDEFEAITEPGAAVKIIGELLKVAHERGFYVVIVSHLGEDLKKELPFARVDGIEARGLDERLNLIVDRQPVFGKVGRSTPELIVERLARKKRGKEKEIFERILKAFKKD